MATWTVQLNSTPPRLWRPEGTAGVRHALAVQTPAAVASTLLLDKRQHQNFPTARRLTLQCKCLIADLNKLEQCALSSLTASFWYCVALLRVPRNWDSELLCKIRWLKSIYCPLGDLRCQASAAGKPGGGVLDRPTTAPPVIDPDQDVR